MTVPAARALKKGSVVNLGNDVVARVTENCANNRMIEVQGHRFIWIHTDKGLQPSNRL